MPSSLKKYFSDEHLFIIFASLAIAVFILLDPTKVYKIFGYSTPFFHQVITEGHRFNSFDDFLSISHILLLLSVYSITMLFGFSLLQSFFRKIPTNIIIKFFASFSVGYIASLGVIRVISFLFKSRFVFLPTVLLILALSTILFYRNRKPYVTKKRANCRFLFLTMFSLLFLMVIFLLIQVYAGEFAWVGHGPHQYSWFLKYIRTNLEISRFPIINQHYDELLYTFFMLDPIDITFNPILPMWVTLAINKVSFFSLAYCIFRFLDIKITTSIIYSLFLLFGTNALDPTKYLLIFDSSNPLAYVVHSTRIVGIGVVFLIVTNFLKPPDKESFLNTTFFIFIGLGIVFTTISNYSILVFIYMVIILFKLLPKLYQVSRYNFKIKNITITPQFVIHLVFIGSAIGYGVLNIKYNFLPGIIHLLIFCMILIFYIHYLIANRSTIMGNLSYNVGTKTSLRNFIIFLLSILYSSLFFANIFSSNILNKTLIEYLNSNTFLSGLTFDTKISTFATSGFKDSIKFLQDSRDIGIWSEYCKGFLYFLGYYGSIYLLSLFPHMAKNENKHQSDFIKSWGALQLLMISLLPILFLHTDFLNYTNIQAWTKTRFLEIPIYLIIFSSMVLISRSSSSVLRRGMIAFQILYILLPIIATMRLHQWLANAKELLNFLK